MELSTVIFEVSKKPNSFSKSKFIVASKVQILNSISWNAFVSSKLVHGHFLSFLMSAGVSIEMFCNCNHPKKKLNIRGHSHTRPSTRPPIKTIVQYFGTCPRTRFTRFALWLLCSVLKKKSVKKITIEVKHSLFNWNSHRF